MALRVRQIVLRSNILDISKQMCLDRGCCYKEGADVSCFYPNMGMANVTNVHVIHGCHFDAGFVDTTVNIVNRYFDEIYPRVYKVLCLLTRYLLCRMLWIMLKPVV